MNCANCGYYIPRDGEVIGMNPLGLCRCKYPAPTQIHLNTTGLGEYTTEELLTELMQREKEK